MRKPAVTGPMVAPRPSRDQRTAGTPDADLVTEVMAIRNPSPVAGGSPGGSGSPQVKSPTQGRDATGEPDSPWPVVAGWARSVTGTATAAAATATAQNPDAAANRARRRAALRIRGPAARCGGPARSASSRNAVRRLSSKSGTVLVASLGSCCGKVALEDRPGVVQCPLDRA